MTRQRELGNKKRARFIPSAIITDRRSSNVSPVLDPPHKRAAVIPTTKLSTIHILSRICGCIAPSVPLGVRYDIDNLLPSPELYERIPAQSLHRIRELGKKIRVLDIARRPPTPASRRGLSPIPFLVDTWYLCKEYLSSCHHPCLRPARCLGPSLRSPYFPAWRAPYLSSFPLSIPSSTSQPPSSVFKDLRSPQLGVHC